MGLIVTANGLLVTEAHCSNCRRRLGVDFQVKTIRVDDRNIAIQLWDTAGTNIGWSFQKIKSFFADPNWLFCKLSADKKILKTLFSYTH